MQFLPMADSAPDEKDRERSLGERIDFSQLIDDSVSKEVCCGGPPPPKSNPFERAGYTLAPYVKGVITDKPNDIPLIECKLGVRDYLGTLLTRLGIIRDDYKVSPGLYGIGNPQKDSPVIVTANYKLTFDSVRKELKSLDCWLLVLDTCGINVWCAAGKQTFSTDEILRQIDLCKLAEKVDHRRLIVPQLGATGVAAHEVKLKSGFRVVYGPILASDLPGFIQEGFKADERMRSVTFTLSERFVLIPVEFYLFSKKIWWIFPLIFLFSGISPELFSFEQSWLRGIAMSLAILFGAIGGAVLTPLFLPWLPGRSFSVKGTFIGVLLAIIFVFTLDGEKLAESFSLFLVISSISSYLAMNFTGSTPYTSPSGVEKEMKIAIPFQLLSLLVAGSIWIYVAF